MRIKQNLRSSVHLLWRNEDLQAGLEAEFSYLFPRTAGAEGNDRVFLDRVRRCGSQPTRSRFEADDVVSLTEYST